MVDTSITGLVIAYGVNAAQNAMMKCKDIRSSIDHTIALLTVYRVADEWKNDPRNVYAKSSQH